MTGGGFVGPARQMMSRRSSARHLRRAAEAQARKNLSVPAMKKIIRRNKQRRTPR